MASAVSNVLDNKAVVVQLVTLKLSDSTCLFSKGGQRALMSAQGFVNRQQEVSSFSSKPLFGFSASASAFGPVLDLVSSYWSHVGNSKSRPVTAACCTARSSHQNYKFI